MKVSLDGLGLRYGDVVAVQNLSLTVEDGQSVVLLGQSGCGKTSTMRCIAGLEVPSEGRISLGEHVVYDSASGANVAAHKRRIGMVFQSYAVWPHMTVLQNVTYPLVVKRTRKATARARALEVLEMVGLAHLADRGASNLSGGQMQRVALARSIAMQPSVLLLDEPLSNLDARLRDDLRVELRRIQQETGLTSVYVTHDQNEALALADRIAVMQGGRITQLAPPAELYDRPASASIAKFLGVTNAFPIGGPAGRGSVVVEGSQCVVTVAEEVAPDDTTVCFRPEAVEVRPAGDTTEGPNTWTGTVRVAVFQGNSVRYSVDLHDGPVVDAVCEVRRGPVQPLGAQVVVRVSPDRVRTLPEETSSTTPATAPDAVLVTS
ncbi:ABC transporter ATP-binding protein [Pseudonocardia ailaonensis]|uniref:ABC transporter ATP-binding protein n=1 Tax=Pseudonocardia ailaonensis TaxID=367279 RepID=A0ABN2N9F1_9PSEU